MSAQDSIWDHLNNCELAFNCPDLPEEIKRSVEETIKRNIPQCLDPIKAKGHCLRLSNELMLNLANEGKLPFVDCKIVFTKRPQPHFWILVDGWHIDLTARQFNAYEPCPKIWKYELSDEKILYSVEKGKGLILFKLVPFHASEHAFPKLRYLYAKLKSLLRPATKPLKELLSNLSKKENYFR